MKVGVNLKIDVSKIDKSKLFKGQKGTYLDAQVFIDIDQKDQYDNNGMITQAVSKQEKDQGVKGAILGNCRVFWKDENQQQNYQPQAQGYQHQQQPAQQSQAQQQPQAQQSAPTDFDSDIPF